MKCTPAGTPEHPCQAVILLWASSNTFQKAGSWPQNEHQRLHFLPSLQHTCDSCIRARSHHLDRRNVSHHDSLFACTWLCAISSKMQRGLSTGRLCGGFSGWRNQLGASPNQNTSSTHEVQTLLNAQAFTAKLEQFLLRTGGCTNIPP